MNPAGEIVMPVQTADAVAQFQLQAMRQITESLNRVTDRLDALTGKVDDALIRLARIESNRLENEVEALRGEVRENDGRIKALEVKQSERVGTARAFDMIVKYGPWALIIVMGCVMALKLSGQIG